MQTHAKQLTKMPSQHSLLGNLLTGHVDNQTPSPLGLLTDGLGQDDQYLDDGQNERRVVPALQDEGEELLLHDLPAAQEEGDVAVRVVVSAEGALQILQPVETVGDGDDLAGSLVLGGDDAADEKELVDDLLVHRKGRVGGVRGRGPLGLGRRGHALRCCCPGLLLGSSTDWNSDGGHFGVNA